jgi:hypothetical protein
MNDKNGLPDKKEIKRIRDNYKSRQEERREWEKGKEVKLLLIAVADATAFTINW